MSELNKINKKALSPTMWLVITIVVVLIVALILVTIFQGTSTKAGKGGQNSIDTSQSGVDAQTCQALCDQCKLVYGSGCNGASWDAMRNGKCAATCS